MEKKPNTRAKGEQLESIANDYLTKRGLALITRNFQCKLGEIDLIMQDNDTLVFVEVRYRRSNRFGSAAETVDRRKQRKLVRTAQLFLKIHHLSQSTPCRFDIVGISPQPRTDTLCFDWIQNAFGTFDSF